MEGVHGVPGTCPACDTPSLALDHQSGDVRCVLCDAAMRPREPFPDDYCDACELPHWPNLVGATSGAAIGRVLDRVAVPYGTNPHQAKGVKTRFPGQDTPIHRPPVRVTTLTLDNLNEELDALLDALYPDALDAAVDGPADPPGR